MTLRELTTDDTQALTRIYDGAAVRHTTGAELTLARAHLKVRTALARAAETSRAQWSWAIVDTHEMIGLVALRRRSPSMGTLSYILREDTWGNGYATAAVKHVVEFAFTTVGLERLEAMHHPDTRPPADTRIARRSMGGAAALARGAAGAGGRRTRGRLLAPRCPKRLRAATAPRTASPFPALPRLGRWEPTAWPRW
ncbi:GNAT family N-acetyltransferase [Streptomyces sp. NPDC001657]|uniref:GNAT family N-acetyltransferase n=1 Tax=Streptomyces sp. NPDC001657 TaxID=3154522 RepID=UPI00332498C1